MISRKKTALVVLTVALAVTAAVLVSRSSSQKHVVRFQVIDYVTGRPIQTPKVAVTRSWTTFPLQEIPLLNLKSWSTKSFVSKSAEIEIAGVHLPDPSFTIAVRAPGYGEALIQSRRPGGSTNLETVVIYYFKTTNPGLHDSPYEYAKLTKPFFVELEPIRGGTNRFGARYPLSPQPGSKERAIAVALAEARKSGTPRVLGGTAFKNGHWEVEIDSVRLVTGGSTVFHISEEGEILSTYFSE